MKPRRKILLRILAIAMILSGVSSLRALPGQTVSTDGKHDIAWSLLRCTRTPLSCRASRSSSGSRRRQQYYSSKIALVAAGDSRLPPKRVTAGRVICRLGCLQRADAAAAALEGPRRGEAVSATTSSTGEESTTKSSSEEVQVVHERFSYPAMDELTFRDLFGGSLPEWLLSRVETLGFVKPTLVQRKALEVILGESRDAVVHAQTGSGKTLAFLLPLFALIDPSRAAVQAIVIVPTRELGLQVASVAKRLAAATGNSTGGKIQVMSVLEGSSNKRQRAWAWAEPPHIVVGNPESLSRLVRNGAVRVNAVSYVVVDEVDACLLSEETRASLHELLAHSLSPTHATGDDLQQEEDEAMGGGEGAAGVGEVGLGKIGGASPAPLPRRIRERQTVFASATVPQHKHFIRQCVQRQWTLTEPVHVQVHAKETMPASLSHFYVVCPPEQKLPVLRALLKRELLSPSRSKGTNARGLVFAAASKPLEQIAPTLERALRAADGREREGADGGSEPPLAEYLREELGLNARADVMSLFREGKTRVLLSTDMAARGLDVPEITHVINLDLPADGEGYVHRGGRAGRLGRPGKVISIVTPPQEFVIRRLGNAIGISIKRIELGSRRRNPSSSTA